jgi:hypothetical protein
MLIQCPSYSDYLLARSEATGLLSDPANSLFPAILSALTFLIYMVFAPIYQMLQDKYFMSMPFHFYQSYFLKIFLKYIVNLNILSYTFYYVVLILPFLVTQNKLSACLI